MSTINEELKNARINKNMTQQELADAIGVSKPYINKIENGITKKPNLNVLSKISMILGIDYVNLIEEFNYDIEDLLNKQNIIKFFNEYHLNDELNAKYIYNNKKYTSEDIIKEFENGNINELDAIYLFINLLEKIEEKQSS